MLPVQKTKRDLFQKEKKYFKKMLNFATSWMVTSKYEVSNLGPTSRKRYTIFKKIFQNELIDLESI